MPFQDRSEAGRKLAAAYYLGSRERADIASYTAIVIDDGVATGATTRAALRATRMHSPKKLILAVPVAPTESLHPYDRKQMKLFALRITSSSERSDCTTVIRQVSDEEVMAILQRFPAQKNLCPRRIPLLPQRLSR